MYAEQFKKDGVVVIPLFKAILRQNYICRRKSESLKVFTDYHIYTIPLYHTISRTTYQEPGESRITRNKI